MDSDLAESVAALKDIFSRRGIQATFGKAEPAVVEELRKTLRVPSRFRSFLQAADPVDVERYTRELRGIGSSGAILWMEARKDVVPLIQTADVVVAPSRWAEPFSRSVIEPLACGVPVVATRVGGNAEILADWLDEYLVPADDVAALAERIESLNAWRAEDPGLGDRCRDAVRVRLSLDGEVDAVESALTSLARTPGPAK